MNKKIWTFVVKRGSKNILQLSLNTVVYCGWRYHQANCWHRQNFLLCTNTGRAKPKKGWRDCPVCHHPHWSALAIAQRTYCQAQWGHPLCSRWSDPSQSLLIEPGSWPSTRQESLKTPHWVDRLHLQDFMFLSELKQSKQSHDSNIFGGFNGGWG